MNFYPSPSTMCRNSEYEKAVLLGSVFALWCRLRGKSPQLVDFEALTAHLHVQNQFDRGIQNIPVKQIVGSVGRKDDFKGNFMPLGRDNGTRWKRVERAYLGGQGMEIIEVYQVGSLYFVIDGNHRVSVSRFYDTEFIAAHVIEIQNHEDIRVTTEARAIYEE